MSTIDTTDKVKTPAESYMDPVPTKEEKEVTIETTTTDKGKDKDKNNEQKPDADNPAVEKSKDDTQTKDVNSEDEEGDEVQRVMDPNSIFFRGIQGDEKR